MLHGLLCCGALVCIMKIPVENSWPFFVIILSLLATAQLYADHALRNSYSRWFRYEIESTAKRPTVHTMHTTHTRHTQLLTHTTLTRKSTHTHTNLIKTCAVLEFVHVAGVISPLLAKEEVAKYTKTLEEFLQTGKKMLESGASSVDVVVCLFERKVEPCYGRTKRSM